MFDYNLTKYSLKKGVIIVLSIIIPFLFIGLYLMVPYFANEQLKSKALSDAKRLVTYVKMYRTYYGKEILPKIKQYSSLSVNFDHKTSKNTVPLPATLLHDMSVALTKDTDVFVKMYSKFPFPNREERVLDDFQNNALEFASNNTKKIYSKEDNINGKRYYRTAFPDPLSAMSCVVCHNTRVDTPKNDWKLNDVRGVIEISIPIDSSNSVISKLVYYIFAFILFNILVFGLYYYLKTRAIKRKLEHEFKNTDNLLQEYKKAVDLGAIVSKADKKGIITYVNDSFIEITGFSEDELLGSQHSIVRHEDTPNETFEELWKEIKNGRVWKGHIKNKKKDGTEYYVHAAIVPIKDLNNNIIEFLAIRYDITSLYEALNLAKIAEKEKGEFLANMSHELRTPLNAIIGFSQILNMKKDIDDKNKDYISKIQVSGKNLLTLVNTILDFSKIHNDEMEFNPEYVNINDLLDEVIILIESQANKKNISITREGISELATMHVDPQLFIQALANILTNSIKFTNEFGQLSIKYKKLNNKNQFILCDTGHGMDKHDIENLFAPFKQGRSAKLSNSKGTGLGMSITHKIITELHSGSIRVTSKKNKGTCFRIIF